MSIIERLYAPISERWSPDAAIDAFDNKDNAIALAPASWVLKDVTVTQALSTTAGD